MQKKKQTVNGVKGPQGSGSLQMFSVQPHFQKVLIVIYTYNLIVFIIRKNMCSLFFAKYPFWFCKYINSKAIV